MLLIGLWHFGLSTSNLHAQPAGSFLPAEILTCPQCQALHMPHSGPKLVILFQVVNLTAKNSFKSCNHNGRIPTALLFGMIHIQTASFLSLSPETYMLPSPQSPQCTAIQKNAKTLVPNSIFFKYITLRYHIFLFSTDTVSGSRSAHTSNSTVTEVAHNWYPLLSVLFM
jgi:hypothetical protein